jgi:hypothetical protein
MFILAFIRMIVTGLYKKCTGKLLAPESMNISATQKWEEYPNLKLQNTPGMRP